MRKFAKVILTIILSGSILFAAVSCTQSTGVQTEAPTYTAVQTATPTLAPIATPKATFASTPDQSTIDATVTQASEAIQSANSAIIYRNYVIQMLMPKYGLVDETLMDAYLTDQYNGDMNAACGLFSVTVKDIDRNGVDELIVLRVGGKGTTLYMDLYTISGENVKELTPAGGQYMMDLFYDPIVATYIYLLDTEKSSYIFLANQNADANVNTYFKVFEMKDGTIGCLLDLVYYSAMDNGAEEAVVCYTGPDEIMSRNRKTGISNLDDRFYDKDAMLMYYQHPVYNNGLTFDFDVQINDLYPDSISAVNHALSLNSVSYNNIIENIDGFILPESFIGIDGANLTELLGGEYAMDDFTGWQAWLDQSEQSSPDAGSTQSVFNKNTIENVTASSYYVEETNTSGMIYHNPENLLDLDLNTAWCEGVSGNGEGEWVCINLNKTATVSGCNFNNGYQKSERLYMYNSRVKTLQVSFSDGTSETFQLEDKLISTEKLTFSVPHQTNYVQFIIIETNTGTKWQDTCISEIELF